MIYEEVGHGWLIWFDRGEWHAKHDDRAGDFGLHAKTRTMMLVMIECRTGVQVEVTQR